RDHVPVDDLDQVDQQAEQCGDGQHHHEPGDDRDPPQRFVGACQHRQPPNLARPRARPATMTSAWSMVVFSCSSAAVLLTARCNGPFNSAACCPIRRASSRIGVTSATTASTTPTPMTNPTVQPVTLVSACASADISHPLAEIADRL